MTLFAWAAGMTLVRGAVVLVIAMRTDVLCVWLVLGHSVTV